MPVLILCTLAALLEGFDVVSMGVAAPKLVPAFGLDVTESSWAFSAATIGLFIGAIIGGRAADFFGRKRALVVSLLLFGAFSWITPFTGNFAELMSARVLTGLGLGGAMPNFITLASESVAPARRLSVVTMIMAGMPFGGALASLVALSNGFGHGWQMIFYVGGVAPIVLALTVAWLLPADARARRGAAMVVPSAAAHAPHTTATPPTVDAPPRVVAPILKVLFGDRQGPTTLLLWTAFFFTQVVLLLLLNWLPSLMVLAGFSGAQASLISVAFNVAGGMASLCMGRLQEGQQRRLWVTVSYLGMALALVVVGGIGGVFLTALLAAAFAGAFVISAQLVLFALAPLYYPTATRGTGVGAAVSAGRLGSVVGPLYAGALLKASGSAAIVILGIQPMVLIGGIAALALTWRAKVSGQA